MFKINFDPEKAKNGKIINPNDLLPKRVESTDGTISDFDPQKIIDSLIKETGLDKEKAIQVTTNVLRRLSALNLKFIPAPHLRELVCGELTSMGLNEYRSQYTRLGIPIYDVRKMLKKQKGKAFFSLLAAQVIEQFVHLDRLNEDAQVIIDEITKYAEDLEPDLKELILSSMENALNIYEKKKKEKLV
jgi:hypothetical protein